MASDTNELARQIRVNLKTPNHERSIAVLSRQVIDKNNTIVLNTDASTGGDFLILKSPNGTSFKIKVNDAGELGATQV